MLANRSKDLKDTFLGFCDAMITMVALFVGGDIALLTRGYDPDEAFDRLTLLVTNCHGVLGTHLILNLIGFRISIARAGDANMHACSLALQPWYAIILFMLVSYMYALLVMLAMHLWGVTDGDTGEIITYCCVGVIFVPPTLLGLIIFARSISHSAGMDDTKPVLPALPGRGPRSYLTAFAALGRKALANAKLDFADLYHGGVA